MEREAPHRGRRPVTVRTRPTEVDGPDLVERVLAEVRSIGQRERRILAIAGPPAAGKSTLAEAIVRRVEDALPGSSALLPMDGFHYDDEVLAALGWRARKGAPHTFDVGGYATALRRVRANDEPSVAVPRFDRTIEIARAGAILIERSVRLVVTEGNYLLLDESPWSELRRWFDRSVLLLPDAATIEARNRGRWVAMGKDEAWIAAKLEGNDLPNARVVVEGSSAADWVVRS